jgi:hypothetical protein
VQVVGYFELKETTLFLNTFYGLYIWTLFDVQLDMLHNYRGRRASFTGRGFDA